MPAIPAHGPSRRAAPPPRSARRRTAARRANAPGRRARTAAHASDSTTSGPTRVGATRKSTHQRSLTTTLHTRTTTHSRPTSRASRSAPPELPDPLLPSFPAFASLPRPSTSAVLIASLVPSSWSSCSSPSLPACRRPASGLPPFTPGLPCPVFVCRSRKGGPARKRWTPLPRKPRRRAKPGPEAGRRPVDLQASTPRDQHQEVDPAPEGACACPVCWVCREGAPRVRGCGCRRPLERDALSRPGFDGDLEARMRPGRKGSWAMARPKKYPDELVQRAVRLALEGDRPIAHIAHDLGMHPETLRKKVRQHEADSGKRPDLPADQPGA